MALEKISEAEGSWVGTVSKGENRVKQASPN